MAKLQNTSIQRKLIIIQVTTAFMAVLICCAAFVYNDISVFKETSVKTQYSIAEVIGINAASALEFADPETAHKMLLKLRSNASILNAVIEDKGGKEFARYNKKGYESFSFPSSATGDMETQKGFSRQFVVSYKITDKEFLGTVRLRSELSEFDTIVLSYIKIAALILLVSLAVALLISSILQQSITTRLFALVNKTKEVADTDNYNLRVPVDGRDEIATLTASFNHMLGQIEKMQGQLKGTNVSLERRVKARTNDLEAANKELERFVYVASHDLQEPLRTISNYTSLLQEGYADKLDPVANKYLNNTVKAASRMRTLIKDLLELSRIGKDVQLTSVDTKSILIEVAAQLDAAIKESNTKITYSGLPVLTGNAVELKQLFQNLISNAIKFRKKGEPCTIRISAEEKLNEYLFSFKDNGIGIEEQYNDRIFVVFQRLHDRTEYPGTGIGLATCQKIVALHKGKIWVESKLGEGSTFYFTLSKNLN
ncbi:MAG: ATP-binding protein [Bacteroidota bacterium]